MKTTPRILDGIAIASEIKAEVAAEVLHNVGNVLNSVNVSVEVLAGAVKNSKGVNLAKVADMLLQHQHDLGEFFARDERGRHLPGYLGELSKRLDSERANLLRVAAMVDRPH